MQPGDDAVPSSATFGRNTESHPERKEEKFDIIETEEKILRDEIPA